MKIKIDKMILGMVMTNCYIVYDEESKKGFIVDPADNGEAIRDRVALHGIQIEGILLTHGHFDHIGAAKFLKESFNCDIYGSIDEKVILENPLNNLSSMYMDQIVLHCDKYLKDKESFTIGNFNITTISTPGHTIGSVCYLVEHWGDFVLFSGDTLFKNSYGRYDFPTGDRFTLMKSIKEKLMILDDELLVLPGHNNETYIGNEKINYV